MTHKSVFMNVYAGRKAPGGHGEKIKAVFLLEAKRIDRSLSYVILKSCMNGPSKHLRTSLHKVRKEIENELR